jgi:hypothetical protein
MLPKHAALPDVLAPLMKDATVATINPRTASNGHGLPLLCGDHLDLLDLATRAEVLTALATLGHARPWMLGAIWSGLTDHQAARCCAAALQAVAEGREPPRSVLDSAVHGYVSAGRRVTSTTWTRRALAGASLLWTVEGQPSISGKTVWWSWMVGDQRGEAKTDPTQAAIDAAHAQGALLVGVDL